MKASSTWPKIWLNELSARNKTFSFWMTTSLFEGWRVSICSTESALMIRFSTSFPLGRTGSRAFQVQSNWIRLLTRLVITNYLMITLFFMLNLYFVNTTCRDSARKFSALTPISLPNWQIGGAPEILIGY